MKDLREELGVATEQVQACGLPCGLPSLQVPSLVDQAAQRCLAEKEKENKAVFRARHRSAGGTAGTPREPPGSLSQALQRKCERLERSLKAFRNAWGTVIRVRDWQSGNRGSGKLWPAAVQDLSLTAGL